VKIIVGIDALPKRIKEHLISQLNFRPSIPRVYHISSLTGCLRKYYYRITHPDQNTFSLESSFHIFRGNLFDRALTSIFPVHQKNYISTKNGITISGTLDMVVYDEELDERILYDLKAPKSTGYLLREGGRVGYKRQVQGYLCLAKASGELTDVSVCRVLSIADDVVICEYLEDPLILDSFFWPRACIIEAAIRANDSSFLHGPEERWECNERFCSVSDEFRQECQCSHAGSIERVLTLVP